MKNIGDARELTVYSESTNTITVGEVIICFSLKK